VLFTLTEYSVWVAMLEPFLAAVLGHAATQRQADRIADTRLAGDGTRRLT